MGKKEKVTAAAIAAGKFILTFLYILARRVLGLFLLIPQLFFIALYYLLRDKKTKVKK